jgi:hypothetical protein
MIRRLWQRSYRLVWRRPTATDKVVALTAGLVGTAMVTSLVLPGRKTAKILEAQTRGMNNVLRAMTGQDADPQERQEPDRRRESDTPTIHTHQFIDGEWQRINRSRK